MRSGEIGQDAVQTLSSEVNCSVRDKSSLLILDSFLVLAN